MEFSHLIDELKNRLPPLSLEMEGPNRYRLLSSDYATAIIDISGRLAMETEIGLIDDSTPQGEGLMLGCLQLALIRSRVGRDYITLKDRLLKLQCWLNSDSTDVETLVDALNHHRDYAEELISQLGLNIDPKSSQVLTRSMVFP